MLQHKVFNIFLDIVALWCSMMLSHSEMYWIWLLWSIPLFCCHSFLYCGLLVYCKHQDIEMYNLKLGTWKEKKKVKLKKKYKQGICIFYVCYLNKRKLSNIFLYFECILIIEALSGVVISVHMSSVWIDHSSGQMPSTHLGPKGEGFNTVDWLFCVWCWHWQLISGWTKQAEEKLNYKTLVPAFASQNSSNHNSKWKIKSWLVSP